METPRSCSGDLVWYTDEAKIRKLTKPGINGEKPKH